MHALLLLWGVVVRESPTLLPPFLLLLLVSPASPLIRTRAYPLRLPVPKPDGTYKSSPFHIRFGKLSIIRPQERIVSRVLAGSQGH